MGFLEKIKQNKEAGAVPAGTTLLYTDGGYSLHIDIGAAAWFAGKPGEPAILAQHGFAMCGTTNNRMELLAVIDALENLEIGPPILLRADSMYVLNGMQFWMGRWSKNGWQSVDKKPIKNKDLWERLSLLKTVHNIKYEHVKGHSGDAGNDYVDKFCTRAINNCFNLVKQGVITGSSHYVDMADPYSIQVKPFAGSGL